MSARMANDQESAGSVPALSGVGLLGANRPAKSERWDGQAKRPYHHGDRRGQVVKHAVDVEAGNLTVVGIGRSVGNKISVKPWVPVFSHQSGGRTGFGQHRQRR